MGETERSIGSELINTERDERTMMGEKDGIKMKSAVIDIRDRNESGEKPRY